MQVGDHLVDRWRALGADFVVFAVFVVVAACICICVCMCVSLLMVRVRWLECVSMPCNLTHDKATIKHTRMVVWTKSTCPVVPDMSGMCVSMFREGVVGSKSMVCVYEKRGQTHGWARSACC